MHTSAPHPTTVAQFSGVLLADAQVRVKPVGTGGQMMPVLCLELQPDHAPGHSIHAEQVFPVAAHRAAEHRAHALHKGTHVTVESPTQHMHLYLPACLHVRATPAQQRPPLQVAA